MTQVDYRASASQNMFHGFFLEPLLNSSFVADAVVSVAFNGRLLEYQVHFEKDYLIYSRRHVPSLSATYKFKMADLMLWTVLKIVQTLRPGLWKMIR